MPQLTRSFGNNARLFAKTTNLGTLGTVLGSVAAAAMMIFAFSPHTNEDEKPKDVITLTPPNTNDGAIEKATANLTRGTLELDDNKGCHYVITPADSGVSQHCGENSRAEIGLVQTTLSPALQTSVNALLQQACTKTKQRPFCGGWGAPS